MAWAAEKTSSFPHEWLFGRRDVPGEHIPMAHLIFDLQALMVLADEQSEAAKKANQG